MSDTSEDTTTQTQNLNDLLSPDLVKTLKWFYAQSSQDCPLVIESDFGVLTFKRWPES